MATKSDITAIDGSLDFSGGIDSNRVTTIQSALNLNGLPRNMLAWLANATVRNGGIRPRSGLKSLGTVRASPGLFQGSFLYEYPGSNPYPVFLMDGILYSIPNPNNPSSVVDLTHGNAALRMPATQPQAYFCQAEEFLIIQSGDYVTLPLFWDGTKLWRSAGLTGAFSIPGQATIKNVNDAANVGVTIPGGQSATYPGITVSGLASFVMPAVGGTVVVNAGAVTGTLPSSNFRLVISASPFTQTGDLQVTAFTGSTINTAATQLPAAGPMCYYMNRVWYAQGRQYSAGDIVRNESSGTIAYDFRDSVLSVTENPLAIGGDGFSVPTNAGNITALNFSANINALLGQGTLYVFTRTEIYAQTVPVTRTDWIAANTNNMPLQYVAQNSTGSVNDRSIVAVNGDLFFQTLQPSIQSLTTAVRNFQQWGDTPVSINENRILAFNDRSLMSVASGIYFDNRMLQAVIPRQTPHGIVSDAIVPLNFDTLSSLGNKLPPVWEGQITFPGVLQLLEGDFGGLQRALAFVISQLDGSLQLWELTFADRTDNGDNRIEWVAEFPAYTWGKEFQLKELMTMEIWLDDVRGTVEITVDYRPDSDTCWYPWHRFRICAARDSSELINSMNPYPTKCGPGYVSTATLPHPPVKCASFTGRPAFIGYQFQPRISIHGWCRVRGIFLHAAEREKELYAGKTC